MKARYLEVSAGVRYWEDALLGGEPDEAGLMPLRSGDRWAPVIDLDCGKIAGWPVGTVARIHYKVCDDGEYWLLDQEGRRVARWADFYVPDDLLCVGDRGFGDYIIFNVSSEGLIEGWRRPTLNDSQWESL